VLVENAPEASIKNYFASILSKSVSVKFVFVHLLHEHIKSGKNQTISTLKAFISDN
jgi:hypothetical protein